MLKIKEQYRTKLEGEEDGLTVSSIQSQDVGEEALSVSSVQSQEGGEDGLTVSSVQSQEYYEDCCHLLSASSYPARSSSPLSRSPPPAVRSSSPPGSSLRRARSSSKKRHSPPSPPRSGSPEAARQAGSLPPATPVSKPSSAKCPRGPAKSRLERVNAFRKKKRLEREEEEERQREVRKQERMEEIKELVRLERERRKREAELMAREAAELVGEEGMVLDEEEELPQVEDVPVNQEHMTTSWTAENPYGAMAKTSFRDCKVKLAALLQQYPLQEQMDLIMNLAAARSLPTLKCPLNQQKMRMIVSHSDLSKFLKSP